MYRNTHQNASYQPPPPPPSQPPPYQAPPAPQLPPVNVNALIEALR